MDETKQNEEKKGEANSDELQKCQKERDEYLEGWKRAKADLANYKKDEAKRFEVVLKFGQESLIRELISVLDSFDLAILSSEMVEDPKLQKGMYLIRQQLEDILGKHGLEKVLVKTGDKFDSLLAEAIAVVESDQPSGTIVEEVERGYYLNGKVIRPVRVKVSK